MEKIWKNFDNESKIVIRKLTGYHKKKFSKLISKLNNSKNNMNKTPELVEVLVQD